MPRHFPAVDGLARQAADAASLVEDPLAALARDIHASMQSQADAYRMLGLLVEATAQVLRIRIPPQRQASTALAIVAMLHHRIRALAGGQEETPGPEL
jgi:hypothetical protein